MDQLDLLIKSMKSPQSTEFKKTYTISNDYLTAPVNFKKFSKLVFLQKGPGECLGNCWFNDKECQQYMNLINLLNPVKPADYLLYVSFPCNFLSVLFKSLP